MSEIPEPGPPFKVGEHVAFGPTVLGPTSMWLKWEEAVILDIDAAAETVGFRFVTDAEGVRHAQGMENIVRVTPNYRSWRAAWDEAYAKAGDEVAADREVSDLWMRVLAEHPIHGRDLKSIRWKGKQ